MHAQSLSTHQITPSVFFHSLVSSTTLKKRGGYFALPIDEMSGGLSARFSVFLPFFYLFFDDSISIRPIVSQETHTPSARHLPPPFGPRHSLRDPHLNVYFSRSPRPLVNKSDSHLTERLPLQSKLVLWRPKQCSGLRLTGYFPRAACWDYNIT